MKDRQADRIVAALELLTLRVETLTEAVVTQHAERQAALTNIRESVDDLHSLVEEQGRNRPESATEGA